MKSLFFSRAVVSGSLVAAGAGCLFLAACASQAPEAPKEGKTQSALASETDFYRGSSLNLQQLALAFDDGPSELTSELSTYLKSEGIRATFFVIGAKVAATQLANPNNYQPVANATAILQQLAADGHLVANHTTTHRNVGTLSTEDRLNDLTEADTLIKTHGKTPWNRSLLRVPGGTTWNNDVKLTLDPTLGHYVGPIGAEIGLLRNKFPKAADDNACFTGELYKDSGGKVHSEENDPIPDGYATSEECGDAYIYEIAAVGKGIVLLREGYSWQEGDKGGNVLDMVKHMVPILKQSGHTFVGIDEIPNVAKDLPKCTPGCYSCSGPNEDQCIACPKNSALVNGKCDSCAPCAAGQFMSAACTSTAPPVCTQCPADTYAKAGAETCTSCTSCNDNDACTKDSCSPTTGCSHEPIAGCTAKQPDPPAPAAEPTGEDESGCSVSAPRTATGTGSLAALGAVALAFAARGRRFRRR